MEISRKTETFFTVAPYFFAKKNVEANLEKRENYSGAIKRGQ